MASESTKTSLKAEENQIPASQQLFPILILRNCSLHSSKKLTFLCTDPSRTDSAFKCDDCFMEQPLKRKHLIPLSHIQDSNEKTVFWNWPLCNESELTERLKAISSKPSQDASQTEEQIDRYFTELRSRILDQIDEVHEQMKIKNAQLSGLDRKVLEKYSQLCAKETLKEISLNTSTDTETLSKEIRQTISDVLARNEATKTELNQSLDELAQSQFVMDLEGPKGIQNEILRKIAQIQMFIGKNEQQNNQQTSSLQSSASRINEMSNFSLIWEVISNRSNRLSENFKEKLKEQMEKFKDAFNELDLGDTTEQIKRLQELRELDEQTLSQIDDFTERLIQYRNSSKNEKQHLEVSDIMGLLDNKSNYLSEEMSKKIKRMLEKVSSYVNTFQVQNIHKEGFTQEQFKGLNDNQLKRGAETIQEIQELLTDDTKSQQGLREIIGVAQQITKSQTNRLNLQEPSSNTLSVERVMKLIKNESNQCSDEFTEQLNSILGGVQQYLASFNVTEADDNQIIRQWEGLDKAQISNLIQLGNKISELSQKYGESYKTLKSPAFEYQPMSFALWNAIQKLQLFSYSERTYLKSLLVQFPICELLSESGKENIPTDLDWVSTSWKDSKKLEIKREDQRWKIIQRKSLAGTVTVGQTLDNSLVYSLEITFNKPLYGSGCITIGLIEESIMNTQYIGEDDNESAFMSTPNFGAKEIVKGKLLNIPPGLQYLTALEFKFCIATQSFYITDLLHTNIIKVKPEKIKKQGKYRFGITLYCPGDDYYCVISNINVSADQSVVDLF